MTEIHYIETRTSKKDFFIKFVPIMLILEVKNKTDVSNKFQSLQAQLKTSIKESKQNYYSRLSNKLLGGKTSSKLHE